MELALLGVALVLAIPAAAIAGVVMAAGARNRLNLIVPRLRALELRFDALLAGTRAAEPPPAPPGPEIAAAPPLEPVEPVAPAEPEPALAASSAIAPPRAPTAPVRSLEERFGTQWVVWVGGVALALGGFFLLRYSIEQGWFGPGARVFLGALLALALIVA